MSELLTRVLVAGEFNQALVDVTIASAQNEMKQRGVELLQVVRVPGCYELPLSRAGRR